VAQSSWPSPDTSRVIDDLAYERLVAAQYVDGLVGSITDTPLVYADGSGRQVFVRANRIAQVRGHGWSSGGSILTLSIAANTSGSTRVDLIVLGLNRSTWNVTAYVKAGTPGSGAPALQTDTGDTGIYEIPLAEVTVPNGATITSAGQVLPRAWYATPYGPAAPGSTVATRPPAPVPGVMMWQNGTAYVWNGTIWEAISNPPLSVASDMGTTLSGNSIRDDNAWHDFPSANWAPLTFTVPPSGRIHVSISGWIQNFHAADSTIWISWRASGGGLAVGTDDNTVRNRAMSTRGGRLIATKRTYFSGLTPGASVTLTPIYASTTTTNDVDISSMSYGRLEMEPAA